MGAFDLIRVLRGAGVDVRSDGGVLDISPADRLTGEMIEALKRHKPEILELLKSESKGNSPAPRLRGDHPDWKPDPCNRCIHLSRFLGGNLCRTDNGLPRVTRLLYEVPEDGGATCTSWNDDRRQGAGAG